MAVILIADGHSRSRRDVAAALASVGHEVHAAARVCDATDAVHRVRPEAVLVDLGLDGGEGLEFILELRRLDPSLKIIAMAAAMGPECGKRLSMAHYFGADGVLEKPLAAARLHAVVRAVLGEGRTRD